MAGQIQIVLDCEDSFKKKAAYTFETFFQILGLPFRFVDSNEVSSSDIGIWYGREIPKISGRVLFIHGNLEAQLLFHQLLQLDKSVVKKTKLDGEDSLALFYDEEFGREGASFISGDDRCRIVHVDIVASAFYFLSCWQEITSTERDQHERFPASASLQYHHGLLHTPIVDQYAQLIGQELERLSGRSIAQIPRFYGKDFAVCMTHDVDYIRKWSLGIIYRELVRYLLLGKGGKNLGGRLKRARAFFQAISARDDPYRSSLEKILSVEKNAGIHATYYLKTGATSRHDVSYRINDGYGRNLVTSLETAGHEIGLHPSYNSFTGSRKIGAEKERLDHVLRAKAGGLRQHFLRFKIPETWRAQAELGFEHDATLGFPGHEGFRAAICHPFRPYDSEKDEVIGIWEVPLLAMDGTFQSYRNKSAEESLEIIKELILTVKKYHGVGVLLFHNTCYDELDFPGWGRVFESSLEFALAEGAFVGSTSEILNSYLRTLNPPPRA
jgi:peptidoglycan/xylan/chitin deacetylase (PgdA/CDA1 family)